MATGQCRHAMVWYGYRGTGKILAVDGYGDRVIGEDNKKKALQLYLQTFIGIVLATEIKN